MYSIKEIYYSLQGEGYNTGRKSIFCRFSACNLWSGKEKDRKSAICNFCDTDFVGNDGQNGGKYHKTTDVADKIEELWFNFNSTKSPPFVVFTGGEPLLQLDDQLINECKKRSFEIAVETNGTLIAPNGINWLTVSPKANAQQRQISGNELKLVYPQENLDPKAFEKLDFEHFYLSPKEVSDKEVCLANINKAIKYCESNKKWKLSLQYHKLAGLP